MAHEGAADGEHLLLTAAHGAGLLLRALLEAREEVEDAVHVLPYPGAIVSVVRAHLQVLEHGHAEEDLAPLRALGDALADHVVRGHALYLLPVEDHPALPRGQDAVDRAKRRGLARPVGADERDDLPLLDDERDPLEG